MSFNPQTHYENRAKVDEQEIAKYYGKSSHGIWKARISWPRGTMTVKRGMQWSRQELIRKKLFLQMLMIHAFPIWVEFDWMRK